MLLQKIIILIFLTLISIIGFTQVEIDHKIIFTGLDSADRQIFQLGEPNSLYSAVRPEDIKYGKFNYATAFGNDTVQLTFPSPINRLNEGDLFFFTYSGTNSDNIYLSVTGMDTLIPLMINSGDPVGRGRLFSGQIVGAIYRNYNAYIITPVSKTCPTGFTKVNDNYCIETSERATSNFFNANNTCIAMNAELCNVGEWYHACVNRVALGLNTMINNFEWLDDATNDVMQAKVIGNTSCNSLGNLYGNTGSAPYRCCYLLK